MINLLLNHGASHEGVYLRLPATPGDIGAAFGMLDKLGTGPVTIFDVECPVPNVRQYIMNCDVNDKDTFEKLQELAKRISTMDRDDGMVFSGALDNESINGLDDMLNIAQSLNNYVIMSDIKTDSDLGRHLVSIGFRECPEAMQAYLDFNAIGRDFRSEYGGAFGAGGFVRRKDFSEQEETAKPIITLYMHTALSRVSGELPYAVKLPATEMQLDRMKDRMCINEFCEANITAIEFAPAYLVDHIPVECAAVGVANDLAMEIEQMMQKDGELLKYFAVLEVEQPQTMSNALNLAMDLDNYERVPENTDEYGMSVLQRYRGDEELFDLIEGYMDFDCFAKDMMHEDGVRRTEYGLVRRCDEPWPEQNYGQQMY